MAGRIPAAIPCLYNTSEIFEARYNAILELLYHIMDRPAKPPATRALYSSLFFLSSSNSNSTILKIATKLPRNKPHLMQSLL